MDVKKISCISTGWGLEIASSLNYDRKKTGYFISENREVFDDWFTIKKENGKKVFRLKKTENGNLICRPSK